MKLNKASVFAQFLLGIILGYGLALIFRSQKCIDNVLIRSIGETHEIYSWDEHDTNAENIKYEIVKPLDVPKLRKLLLVGVMTTKHFLRTRALAAHQTWAQSVPGDVIFFTSEDSGFVREHPEMRIVSLPGVTDDYPPQRKSFYMLKYMHDMYGDSYEWFARLDDDAYLRGDKMADFLYSVNSSMPHYLGQAAQGRKDEIGHLGLKRGWNYCMGGTGVVISSPVLHKVAGHVEGCLADLRSTHEDVELGRCIKKFAKVSCLRKQKSNKWFHQNYNEYSGSYTNPESERSAILSAQTLHPFKNFRYLYNMKQYLSKIRCEYLLRRQGRLYKELYHLKTFISLVKAEKL